MTDTETETPLKKWERCDETKVDNFWDRARQGLHCSLFCGGVHCKHENWDVFLQISTVPAAIKGLNSSWVGENVVASQRLATSLFRKHELIQQFQEKQITGVFNLQEKGEHSSCGPDPLCAQSGYSYNGEDDLMRFGVCYYEYPWPDMTAPDHDTVLRTVQVMDSHIRAKGKVLVHCHAGLGRTGLMIACYYMYSQHMSADEAIELVRNNRPKSIQTNSQVAFCQGFAQFLASLYSAYRGEIDDSSIDLVTYVKKQRMFLHGEESTWFRYIPKHIHASLCRLVILTEGEPIQAALALESFSPSGTPGPEALQAMRLSINQNKFNPKNEKKVTLLAYIVQDWFKSFSQPLLSIKDANTILAWCKAQLGPDWMGNQCPIHSLDPIVKNTMNLVLSTIWMLSKKAGDQLKRFALHCTTDTWFHFHKRSNANMLSASERQLLYEFFGRWTDTIQDGCYNLAAKDHATKLAAAASHATIAREAN